MHIDCYFLCFNYYVMLFWPERVIYSLKCRLETLLYLLLFGVAHMLCHENKKERRKKQNQTFLMAHLLLNVLKTKTIFEKKIAFMLIYGLVAGRQQVWLGGWLLIAMCVRLFLVLIFVNVFFLLAYMYLCTPSHGVHVWWLRLYCSFKMSNCIILSILPHLKFVLQSTIATFFQFYKPKVRAQLVYAIFLNCIYSQTEMIR